jgi:hypothetical protein
MKQESLVDKKEDIVGKIIRTVSGVNSAVSIAF